MLSKKQYLLSGIAAAVVISGVVLITMHMSSHASGPNPDLYQAVFLDNDRAYFGHLKRADSQFFLLEDVYYVEAGSALPGQSPTSNRLIRLGAVESHGPENMMMIQQNHIRVWENLRPNSPLVQAIINLKLQAGH